VLGLADAAAAADGVGPLSEQVRLHLEYGGDHAARDLLLRRGDVLAGYSHLGEPDPAGHRSGELVIHPAQRRRGLGLTLARAAVAGAGPLPVRIWAHGDLPAAAGLAAAAGFTRVRSLFQMRRSLAGPLPEPRLPDGITLRSFVPGRDEDEWLALNAAAFAGHPEQGGWTRGELEHREAQPWFDPAGFFLAVRAGRLAGFHWTKIHAPAGGSAEAGPGGDAEAEAGGDAEAGPGGDAESEAGPTGEVYVVGVHPAEQGTGLGRALTLAGLHYLRAREIPSVMLYVDGENTAAIRLYASLGFGHTGTDVMYEHAAAPAGAPEDRITSRSHGSRGSGGLGPPG
jgi:mycothiol synthase